ncbi:alpha-amylase [Anaeramoeba ignava]|uniref:alpha-amylase n=1 Tax=Anaeramoeba ignava TaxID=1746090 RepID=A0A9Q0LLE1_ANAIG|nr:alpha-amylase [Anaeramoeba ignava]|eukprot:Anaeramoba_ignava/a479773_231.p1 GENE.a479773_231~~a479773_231.p1  ORF type:complete len:458 (+),score=149.38 a479773_231:43-1416(+)
MLQKVFLVLFFFSIVFSHSASEWKQSRVIYQLLTDRFAKTTGNTGSCADLSNYCGGTFQGIINHLDYIKGMGFNAIWISPIPKNTEGGYHGYWQQDIYEVNPHFGSADDLTNLIKAAHDKGIWVMGDVVANHVGNVDMDFAAITPFNTSDSYHSKCQIVDWNNQWQVENCRLCNLPDLAQENAFVKTTLLNWVHDIVQNYGFDGLRIDTTQEVPKDFWTLYSQSAGVYTVGEIYNGDVGYVAGYQGCIDATLSYPLYFTLISVFANKQSMYQIQSEYEAYASNFPDMSILGTFIDNHDQPRFLDLNGDYTSYKNAIAFVLMAEGIPIIYYGTEQGFAGASDPNNREDLWRSGYNENSELYQYIKQINEFRTSSKFDNTQKQIQRYADDNFYAFTRGTVFAAFTNKGTNGQVSRLITYHPYSDGTKLCNLFDLSDCFVVNNGQFTINLNGLPKIYYEV